MGAAYISCCRYARAVLDKHVHPEDVHNVLGRPPGSESRERSKRWVCGAARHGLLVFILRVVTSRWGTYMYILSVHVHW